MHKPLLDIALVYRPKEAQPRELLELQNRQSMVLSNIPDARFRKHRIGENACASVECIGYDPVEHLDQEREFLQDSAVVVIGESRGVWRVQRGSTTSPPLRRVLHRAHRIYTRIIGVVGDHVVPSQ